MLRWRHINIKQTSPGMKGIWKGLSHFLIPWLFNAESVCLDFRSYYIPHFGKLCSGFTVFAKGSSSFFPKFPKALFFLQRLFEYFFSFPSTSSPVTKCKVCWYIFFSVVTTFSHSLLQLDFVIWVVICFFLVSAINLILACVNMQGSLLLSVFVLLLLFVAWSKVARKNTMVS